eukprot:g429.t1
MAKTGNQWNFQDKNQRVSRVNSEFLRNSISQHMCQDGSVNLPTQEVDAIIRNLSRKEKKISKLWWALGFAAIFSVALFALTFASALSANEASKESHVEGSQLVDLDGNAVETAAIASFMDISALLQYDAVTLASVNTLNLKLQDGGEIAFDITGVHKAQACKQQATFMTPGGSIVVDGKLGSITAIVGEDEYEVDMDSTAVSHDTGRHLMTTDEFFGGRSLAASTQSGWAKLALAVGEEVLDSNPCGQVSGTARAHGTDVDEGEQPTAITVAFNVDSKTDFKMFITSDADDKAMYFDQEILAKGVITDGSFVIETCEDSEVSELSSGSDSLNNDIEGIEFDGDMTYDADYVELVIPGFIDIKAACGALMAQASADNAERVRKLRATEEGRRQLREESLNLYKEGIEGMEDGAERRKLAAADNMASDAYNSCTWSNGNACVIRDECKFAFRGSDDFQDWVSNAAGVFSATWVNGRKLHGGFVNEFNKINSVSGFRSAVNGCSNPNWIGHSLGGAIATVARQYYGKGYVTTFGAPQLFDHRPGCAMSGRGRHYHEADPVAGNLYGAMGGYWHGQSSKELYWRCSSRHWWGGCRSSGYSWRNRGCYDNSGTFDLNFGAHSMDNYKNYY